MAIRAKRHLKVFGKRGVGGNAFFRKGFPPHHIDIIPLSVVEGGSGEVVGAEGGGGEAFLVVEVADGVVGPGV